MGIKEQVRTWARSYLLGVEVQQFDQAFGHSSEDWNPAAYGDYIATSNAVYSCATLRASLLASLPLRLLRDVKDDEAEEVVQGDLYDLLRKVNPFWTFNRLIQMTELALCLWGEAFWFLERGNSGNGTPREIWWARPDRVRVVPHPTDYIAGYLYQPSGAAKPIAFSPGETLRLAYSNPVDELEGLSPMAAARLAADTSSAALQSNRNLFANGLQPGGWVMPNDKAGNWTPEQQAEMRKLLNQSFKGVDNAHRWGVFRQAVNVKDVGVSPKDAEFLGLLKWGLEDVCRAYKVPLDMVGGQRTYSNVEGSEKAIWERCIIPEGTFIASEMEEQLLPMFTGIDHVEFDSSDVTVLQTDLTEQWQRQEGQLKLGAITVNEWRNEQGLEPVEWGDEPVRQASAFGMGIGEPEPETEPEEEAPEDEEEDEGRSRTYRRAIEYDSPEHRRIWNRSTRRAERWEGRWYDLMADLFKRQMASVIDKIKAQEKRSVRFSVTDLLGKVFNGAQWVRAFRVAARPLLADNVEDAANSALEDLFLDTAFDPTWSEARRFLEQRAQRFATHVNDTTWNDLKRVLGAGADEGLSMEELADRTEDLFTGYYRKTGDEEMLAKATRAFTIARTEVLGASNGGALLAWEQCGEVETKTWIAALDEVTRESHVVAHGQTVPLKSDFVLDGGRGPSPGQIGVAAEDINCRCTMIAGLKVT